MSETKWLLRLHRFSFNFITFFSQKILTHTIKTFIFYTHKYWRNNFLSPKSRKKFYGHNDIYDHRNRFYMLYTPFDGTLVSNLPILIADVMLTAHKFYIPLPLLCIRHNTTLFFARTRKKKNIKRDIRWWWWCCSKWIQIPLFCKFKFFWFFYGS